MDDEAEVEIGKNKEYRERGHAYATETTMFLTGCFSLCAFCAKEKSGLGFLSLLRLLPKQKIYIEPVGTGVPTVRGHFGYKMNFRL